MRCLSGTSYGTVLEGLNRPQQHTRKSRVNNANHKIRTPPPPPLASTTVKALKTTETTPPVVLTRGDVYARPETAQAMIAGGGR